MNHLKEIIFYPLVISFFWRQNKAEVERLVRQTFGRRFSFKEQGVEIPPEKILSLEETLNALKRIPGGVSFPILPISLAPLGSFKKTLLRPGKVYLDPKEKEAFEERLSRLPFLARLVPWDDLYELQLPATTDPELLFRYRDLLLVGPYKPCLHCGLPWHRTSSCPGRKGRRPGKILLDWLHQPLAKIGEELNKTFENLRTKESQAVLSALSERFPYLQPGFLRNLFTTRAKNWEQFNIFQEVLAPGGKLFIALEALQAGQLSEAQRRFEIIFEEGKDWRAALGLAFVSLDKEDLIEALYYVESALGQIERPLLQAYLFFLKGWLLENKGDFHQAEEAYRQALKKDRTCFPAQFHLRLFMTRYALWEDILTHLTLVLNHPLGFLLSFLEPRFLPVAPKLEEELERTFKERQAQAVSRLAAAENNLRPVIKLMPEKQAQELQESLENIRRKIYEGGYLDFFWAEEKAFSLSLEGQGLLYREISEARAKYNEFRDDYEEYEKFWRTKGGKDPEFKVLLDEFYQTLAEIEKALKTNPSHHLRFCVQKFEKLEKKKQELERLKEELLVRLRFKKQLAVFVKTFLLSEIFLFCSFLILPRLIRFLSPTTKKFFFLSPSTFLLFSFLFLVMAIFRALAQKN